MEQWGQKTASVFIAARQTALQAGDITLAISSLHDGKVACGRSSGLDYKSLQSSYRSSSALLLALAQVDSRTSCMPSSREEQDDVAH